MEKNNLTQMKGLIKNILREETQCSFEWAKNLKYWGKNSGWRKGMIKTINRALKDVYSDMWERPTKKHMSSGGVVGYEVANGSTFGWSILNFFNAHRNVREALIDEYSKQYSWWESKTYKPCEFKIGEFLNWLFDERQTIFGKGTPMVKKLAELNHRTWNRGSKNEGDAVDYLTTLYGPNWGADWSGEPGMFSDAITGVDITMMNKNTGREHGYQAKPFMGIELKDGDGVDEWWVESKGLYEYPMKTVNYYIFNTSGRDGVAIFKNEGQKPTVINGKEYMVFDYPPVAQTS